MNQTLVNASIHSFQEAMNTLAQGVASFVPKFIVAFVAFVILWIVAVAVGKLVEQVIRSLKIDSLLQSLGADQPIERAGFKLNVGAFFGGLVRWFFIIVAFLVAVDIMGLSDVGNFLANIVLGYIPKVIVAALMLVAAAIIADAAQKIVRGAAQAAGVPSAAFAGAVAKWSIWVFGFLAAFYQLNIIPELIQTIFTAFVAMLAIAGGLAFGLGGKDHASEFIGRLRKEMKEK